MKNFVDKLPKIEIPPILTSSVEIRVPLTADLSHPDFYQIVCQLPPTDNNCYANRRPGRNGHKGRIITREATAFKKIIGYEMLMLGIRPDAGRAWRSAFIAGRLFLTPKRYCKRDARGSWKLVEDAIAKYLGFNDVIITCCFFQKLRSKEDRCQVIVGELKGDDLDISAIKNHFDLYNK